MFLTSVWLMASTIFISLEINPALLVMTMLKMAIHNPCWIFDYHIDNLFLHIVRYLDWFVLVYFGYYSIYTIFIETVYPFSYIAIMMVSCLLISGTVYPSSLSRIIFALYPDLYPQA